MWYTSFARRMRSSDQSWTERNWIPLFVLIALFVNALHVWALRWHVEPDGMSYIDIAWVYAHGDWSHAINAFWSPLFSWILGVLLWVSGADRFRELAILHAVNFVAFVLAMATFVLLVREIQKWQDCLATEEGTEPLTPGEFSLASYAMFIYASRLVFSPFIDQPDIMVEALVFLDTALLVRVARGDQRVRTFAVLGSVLGVGYLTKTVMFPLGLVFLACAFLASGGTWRAMRRTLVAVLIFGAIAGPWIVVLSHKEGQPTIGTAGHIAYFVYSNGMEASDLWMGGPPGSAPVHPIQVALNSPPVLLFPSKQGTFPPWYDPSFYFAGAVNRVSFHGQFLILRKSLASCLQILSAEKIRLVALFILALFSGLRRYCQEFLRRWPIWLPSAAALAAYALIEFSPRLVLPFLMVFWVALLSAVSVPRTQETRRMVLCVIAVIVLLLCLPVVQAPASDIRALRIPLEQWEGVCGPQLKVARGFREMGLVEGNQVAIIGKDQAQTECWAELDGLSIIGEIPSGGADSYWKAAPEVQARILRIFASAGAKATVTYTMPVSGKPIDWQRIDDTPYYVRFLDNGPDGNATNQLRTSPR
jgi:hypothetical protein